MRTVEPATESGCNTYYAVKHRLLSAYAAEREAEVDRLPKGTVAWATAMAKVTVAYWAIGQLEDTRLPTWN